MGTSTLSRILRSCLLAALVAWGSPSEAVIVITEILYHPAGGGRDLEYVELFNDSSDPLDITGYFFSEGIVFVFTERTFLDPGQYLVVCANAAEVKRHYGIQNAVGDFLADSSLDNGGERISLANPAGVIECTVRYNDRGRWPSAADGTGHSLEIRDPFLDIGDADNWVASADIGGSPGKPNGTVSAPVPVLLNEAYCLPTGGDGRWVEIYNSGDAELDLSGFVLSTDRLAEVSAVLPPGSTVAPRSWISFSDGDLGLDFTPEASQPVPGGLPRRFLCLWTPAKDRVVDARDFEPVEGLSEARIPDGDRSFSTAAVPTRDEANRVDVSTDVVINEIMYRPIDRDVRGEYLELYNQGSQSVPLEGWRFTDGITFTFPPGASIAPGEYLVVARHPDHIRDVYELESSQVVGPDEEEAFEAFGVFADGGERVTLVDSNGNVADTLRYYDGGEWPIWADGGGSSMELIDPTQDNAIGQAWDSSDDSANAPIVEYHYQGGYYPGEPDGPEFHLVVPGGGITVVDDLKMVTQTESVDPIETYIAFDDTWQYFKGTEEPSDPLELWRQIDFDDSSWLTGQAIFGYGDSDVVTILDDMRDIYSSIYFRREFQIDDPSALEDLILEVEFDDGYIAYLNGTEVAINNMPDDRSHTAEAGSSREKAYDRIVLTDRKDELLVAGKNVLAVQVHNTSLRSNDARFQARLVNGRVVITEGSNLFVDGTFEDAANVRRYWTIQGTHVRSGRSESDSISGQASLKIVSSGGGDNKVNRIETSNAGFPTALQTGVLYHISFLARWVAGSPTLLTHGAYGSSNPSYATSTRLEVPRKLGTPGAENSVTRRQIERVGSRNVGPVIVAVSHDPPIPANGQTVRIRARVYDPDGVSEVAFHYSVGVARRLGQAGLVDLPMEGPDPDGYYSVEVPPQELRRSIVGFITATDALGQMGRFPRDRVQTTHPVVLDPENTTANDDLYMIYRHDTRSSGREQVYRIWMHQATYQDLAGRPLLSNDYAYGTLIFQDQHIYYNTKFRFSGSPWARQRWTESYRIQFPKDKPLHGRIHSFNTEDHQGAGAKDARERISHYLLRWFNEGRMRMPYSISWLVRLQIGNPSSTGDALNDIREQTQTPNREFIARWFADDDDGDFFEMDDRFIITDAGAKTGGEPPNGRLMYPPYGSPTLGEDKEMYRYFLSPRMFRELDDYSEIIRLAKVLSPTATSTEAFGEQVWDMVNVEEFCCNWAIRLNTDDWDTWGANRGKNCYFYRPPLDGRWVNIAWDMELSYGNTGSFMPPALTVSSNPSHAINGKFPEVLRFINHPPIKRIYYGVMKEMIGRQFRGDFLDPYMRKLAAIGMQNTQVGLVNGYIDQRRRALENVTRGVSDPVVSFIVSADPDGKIQSTTPTVTVSGRAPIEVRTIVVLVDRKPADDWKVRFSDTSVIEWTATGVLDEGPHRVDFIAYDGFDQLFDSTFVEVTVLPSAPPTILSMSSTSGRPGDPLMILGDSLQLGLQVFFGEVEAYDVTFDPDTDPTRIDVAVPADLDPGEITVIVRNPGGKESNPALFEVLGSEPFVRGDPNADGAVDLTDAIVILDYLFRRGQMPACLDAADVDDDGRINVTDPILLLGHLFQSGPEPAPPYPNPGVDPSDDDALECEIGRPGA